MHFWQKNVRTSIQFSLKFVFRGQIDNKPTLVEELAQRRIGGTPFTEQMLVQFIDAYLRQNVERS